MLVVLTESFDLAATTTITFWNGFDHVDLGTRAVDTPESDSKRFF